MADQHIDLDAALFAASDGDGELLAELRGAFAASVRLHVDLLRRSRCDGNWNLAAHRLKGLGASFHAMPLIALADEALQGAPGEPVVLRKLEQFLGEISAGCR